MKKHYRLTEPHEVNGSMHKAGTVHLLDEDHPAVKTAEELDDRGLPVKGKSDDEPRRSHPVTTQAPARDRK